MYFPIVHEWNWCTKLSWNCVYGFVVIFSTDAIHLPFPHSMHDSKTSSIFNSQLKKKPLTSENHHADSEHLLHLCVWGDVPKPDGSHAGQRVVQRRGVGHGIVRAPDPLFLTRGIVRGVRLVYNFAQVVKPSVVDALLSFRLPDVVPHAGEPVSNQNEHEYEQHENSGAIFQVVVQLPSYSPESQKSHDFQRTEQTTDTLQEKKWCMQEKKIQTQGRLGPERILRKTLM